MKSDNFANLGLVSALAGVLSGKEFGKLQVKIGPMVCYVPDEDTIILPGVPFGQMDPEVREYLFAYLGHEAAGERAESTWCPQGYEDGHRMLVNGMNDARIDRIILRKWPGAGIAVRNVVQKDHDALMGSGRDCYNVTALAVALRYLGEGITTVEQLRTLKGLGPLLDIALPHIDGIDWDGPESDIIARATRIWEALQPPEPPPSPSQPEEGEGDEGEDDEDEEGKGANSGADTQPKEEGEGDDDEGDGTGAGADTGADGADDRADGSDGPSGDSDSEGEGDEEDGDDGGPSDREDGDDDSDDEEDGDDADGDAEGEAEGAVEARPAEAVPLGDGKTTEDRTKELLQAALGQPARGRTPEQIHAYSGAVFSFNPYTEHLTPSPSARMTKHGLVARFVSLFTALRDAEGREIVHKQQMGELDLDRLPLALGGVSDTVHYRIRRAVSEQMAVFVSADCTGSLSHRGDEYFDMLTALSAALQRLAVPHEVTGWTGGMGVGDRRFTQHYSTRFYHFKRFEDKGPARLPSKGGILWAFNADMPALLEAYTRLILRPEAGKLVMHFTDGLPCIDCAKDRRRNDTMRQAMHYTVKQMRANGIDVVGIGIGMNSSTTETMNHIFGEGYWVPIPSLHNVDLGFARGIQSVVRRMREGRRA